MFELANKDNPISAMRPDERRAPMFAANDEIANNQAYFSALYDPYKTIPLIYAYHFAKRLIEIPDLADTIENFQFNNFKTKGNYQVAIEKMDPISRFISLIWCEPDSHGMSWYRESTQISRDMVGSAFLSWQAQNIDAKRSIDKARFWSEVDKWLTKNIEGKKVKGVRMIMLESKDHIAKVFKRKTGGIDVEQLANMQ